MLNTFIIQKASFGQTNSEACGLLRFPRNIPTVEYANTDQVCSWSGEVMGSEDLRTNSTF